MWVLMGTLSILDLEEKSLVISLIDSSKTSEKLRHH